MHVDDRLLAASADVIAALLAGGSSDDPAFEMVVWRGATPVSQRQTRRELVHAVRQAAGFIGARTAPGDRVIVAPPPGFDFVALFLGCLATGRIAVPAQTPTTGRARAFIERIAAVTEATLTITENGVARDAPEAEISSPSSWSDAYIQFTSGSTQAPRGAVITYGALCSNIAAIRNAWRLGPEDHGVFWLPPFHDMGLVGALLTPVACGFPATLMHPAAFLQRPRRWLELIAARRATFSGAPNFAYDLCVDRIDHAARIGLDLSSWRVAVNGAEPVSAATLSRFAAAFSPCGFRADALAPGYGLAESVLFVTAQRATKHEPAQDGVVSCGAPGLGMCVQIVDEARGVALPDGQTGAIWVAGPSLARGYWQAPAETAAAFDAHLPSDERRYLRTGDIGCLRGGALFVQGRAKDIIVRAGRKTHAADIEHAIAARTASHRRSAVFACAADSEEERLVVVHEIANDADDIATRDAIADALGVGFDLIADDIVLTAPGGVRVTTSGKIARAATRDAYCAGALNRRPAHTN